MTSLTHMQPIQQSNSHKVQHTKKWDIQNAVYRKNRAHLQARMLAHNQSPNLSLTSTKIITMTVIDTHIRIAYIQQSRKVA